MRCSLAIGCFMLVQLVAGGAEALGDGRLFDGPDVEEVVLSPDGELVAMLRHRVRRHVPDVIVHHVKSGKELRVLAVADGPDIVIRSLRWADAEHLILAAGVRRESQGGWWRPRVTDTLLSRIRSTPRGLTHEDFKLPIEGAIVDVLPREAGVVLLAPYDEARRVYRVRLDTGLDARQAGSQTELMKRAVLAAAAEHDVVRWFTDRDGAVRAAIAITDDDEIRVLHRARVGRPFEALLTGTAQDPPPWLPLGFDTDGRNLLVISTKEAAPSMFRYDPIERRRGKRIFTSDSAHVQGVFTGVDGRPAGVITVRRGFNQREYFGHDDRALVRSLAQRLDRNVLVLDRSLDGSALLILAESPSDPGVYYHYDVGQAAVHKIAEVAPELTQAGLAPVHVLRVQSGGHLVEAFLAVPPSDTPPPLVVLPHGGPIGVSDVRHFNPEVQYLASAGLAVLQVNYRGSMGYGEAFLESGKGEWGRGIEDDVDAAVTAAIASGRVDGERVCIAGASYGGYSALMSVIRHPKRYRCAAALAAPTDIPLMFSTSDFARTKEGRARFAELVGDPDAQYVKLRNRSPVYWADRIQVPVHIAHGLRDRRVDPEHSLRMLLMLDALDADYVWEPYPKQGHSGWSAARERAFHRSRLRFLLKHLKGARARR